MKTVTVYIVILYALLHFAGLRAQPVPLPRGFALVELFTAEGCSSCPPADLLLGEMTNILGKEGKQVIPLSFHVTYWNRYGWNDPYSQEVFTERQKKYQRTLKLDELFTPQAIVNGMQSFTGSNPVAFRTLASEAVNENPLYTMHAGIERGEGQLQVNCSLDHTPRHSVLNIALVEKEVVHLVDAGENAHKTLHHTNLVRQWVTITAQVNNKIMIGWPENLSPANSLLILYVQNTKTMQVEAAQIVAL